MKTTLVINWYIVLSVGAWLCLFAVIASSWNASSEAERRQRALDAANKE
jgi:hypothetical protein